MINISNITDQAQILNELIDQRFYSLNKQLKYVLQIYATVMSVDNINCTAVVNFPNDTTNITYNNMSGHELNVGDTVLIEYKNGSNLSTGYIVANLTSPSTSSTYCNSLSLSASSYRACEYTSTTMTFVIPTPQTLSGSVTFSVSPTLKTLSGTSQTGFTFTYTVMSNGIKVVATKSSHGLTDGTLYVAACTVTA